LHELLSTKKAQSQQPKPSLLNNRDLKKEIKEMSEERLDPKAQAEILQNNPTQANDASFVTASFVTGDIEIWITNIDGYIGLNWKNAESIGDHDYIALYVNQPTDPYGYITSQWQWATKPQPYKTGTPYRENYWLAYISYDYGAGSYKILKIAAPPATHG
jgi:hypothetical protein